MFKRGASTRRQAGDASGVFRDWVDRGRGTPNPFLGLKTPSARWEPVWLTREEFTHLLAGAKCPTRFMPAMVERDTLILMAVLLTGMSRSELIAVRWEDVDLGWQRPSLVIPCVKDGRRRRQPLPTQLAAELRSWREFRDPDREDHVFCALGGRRLDATKVERIITSAASRVLLDKHVTAQTLRDTAARRSAHSRSTRCSG